MAISKNRVPLDDFLKQDSEAFRGLGPSADIVMSSRTRLARNLDKVPFSNWANTRQLEEVMVAVKDAAFSTNFLKNAYFFRLKDLSEVDRFFLVERRLMSPEHANNAEFKALIVDPKEIVSIMINEEDHIRMQIGRAHV